MKKIILIAAVAMLGACSTVTIRHSEKMPPAYPTQQIHNEFFVGGIGQEKILDPLDICDGRGYTISTQYTFIDGLLATFTMGIYSPSTSKVYCDKLK